MRLRGEKSDVIHARGLRKIHKQKTVMTSRHQVVFAWPLLAGTKSQTTLNRVLLCHRRMSVASNDLDSISDRLLQTTSLVNPPGKTRNPRLTAQIADLRVHPSLEALLHILNADLPSAHFLVRHMQAPPAVEGMLLHSVLHRVEGDFNNARAWMDDVKDACEGWVPKKRSEGQQLDEDILDQMQGGRNVKISLIEYVYQEGEAKTLIDTTESFRKLKGKKADGDEARIEESIREELRRVLSWCRQKFGDRAWEDASSAWVKNSEEVSKMSNDMISGDKGYRKF